MMPSEKAAYEMFELDLAYGRTGSVVIVKDIDCDKCHQKRTCMCIDTSDGEYGSVALCQACIKAAFSLEETDDAI